MTSDDAQWNASRDQPSPEQSLARLICPGIMAKWKRKSLAQPELSPKNVGISMASISISSQLLVRTLGHLILFDLHLCRSNRQKFEFKVLVYSFFLFFNVIVLPSPLSYS